MAEKQRTKIDAELLEGMRRLAEHRGVSVEKLLEEAVAVYLASTPGWDDVASEALGARVGEIEITPRESSPRDPFLALLDRMSGRFDLDEDEAERIAVEEQHAWRRERREQSDRERAER
jgi:hypothetical protein